MLSPSSPKLFHWKRYTFLTAKFIALFYVATFCMGIYFTHGGTQSIFQSILMVLLYVFIIGMIIKNIIEKFSIAALMLVIPIAPLMALILILSLLPILQRLH